MEEQIKNLLSDVTNIVKKYEEIAKLSGENFNIFSILKIESDEVRLHSRLLGEMLNPNGTHGRNDVFLKLFIETLDLSKKYTNVDLSKAKVIVEENIGNISDDYTKGGRIDLVIKFNGQAEEIVIENKIYAIDQYNQLGRYIDAYPNANILYLTLEGKKPTDMSFGERAPSETVNCISYKKDIKLWIENCLEKSSEFPLLRETLSQYLQLIKHLTNQTMNEDMKNELAETIIKNSDYIKAAQEITSIWEHCKNKIIINLRPYIEKIAKELNLEYEVSEISLGKADSGFWFYRNDWDYCILFYFEGDYNKVLIGIDNKENEQKCSEENINNIKNKFSGFEMRNIEKYKNWIWVTQFEEWSNTSWENIEKEMPELIKEKTQKILSQLDKQIE